MGDRYFELQEAQAMIGQLEELFNYLSGLREQVVKIHAEIQKLESVSYTNGGGDTPKMVGEYHRSLEETLAHIKAVVEPFQEQGVIIKSIEDGLVDFPFLRQGQSVYLCWKMGEVEIKYWHDLNSGFSGRQIL